MADNEIVEVELELGSDNTNDNTNNNTDDNANCCLHKKQLLMCCLILLCIIIGGFAVNTGNFVWLGNQRKHCNQNITLIWMDYPNQCGEIQTICARCPVTDHQKIKECIQMTGCPTVRP